MEIKKQIAVSIGDALKSMTGLDVEPQVQASGDLSKGDYSSNVAMATFGNIKSSTFAKASADKQIPNIKSPMEFAQSIAELLNTKYKIQNTVERVEVKTPGFINFWLSQAYVSKVISRVLEVSERIDPATLSSLIFEFGDPNPFKEPHIGHMRNFVLGESICRLSEANGAKVVRASYQGDVGMHVAKALYGLLQMANGKWQMANLDGGTLGEKARFLGKAYAFGSKAFEEDEAAKLEIASINKQIYSKDSSVIDLWEKGRKISLDYFETLYEKLGIKYEKFYFESQAAPEGLKIVEKNIGQVFEKDDGAIVFRGEKLGLHTRVFVNSEGHATYEGKDLALAVMKDKDFPEIDRSIIMTANEQADYFKVLLAALKLVNPKIAEKTSHLSFGFVNLKEGKMSSRTGNVVPAFWLLDKTQKRLKNGFKEVSNSVLEDLSVGAVKWSMLKFSRESNISFDIEESVQIEGNSGPYMQYAYARTQSLLGNASKSLGEAKFRENLEPELLALARIICQFESIVKEAAENFSPNILCNYLFDLAQNFNLFYEKKKIIGADDEEQKLLLTKAVGNVLKKGLYLLGIEAPEKI